MGCVCVCVCVCRVAWFLVSESFSALFPEARFREGTELEANTHYPHTHTLPTHTHTTHTHTQVRMCDEMSVGKTSS